MRRDHQLIRPSYHDILYTHTFYVTSLSLCARGGDILTTCPLLKHIFHHTDSVHLSLLYARPLSFGGCTVRYQQDNQNTGRVVGDTENDIN